MGDTKIAWTNKTWNPVIGCSHVTDGCRNCYAERIYRRFHKGTLPWTAENARSNIHCISDRLSQPSHWRKPAMVFVNSMSDLFHEQVPDEFIAAAWHQMRNNDRHTYQILTKRPKRMLEWVRYWYPSGSTPAPNVWLGVSVENQRAADERIPVLLQTPAAIRFLSCEPLLEALELQVANGEPYFRRSYLEFDQRVKGGTDSTYTRVDWVIVGGESGQHFRPMNLDWASYLRDQCIAAEVPFFFKQGSGPRPGTNALLDGVEWHQFPKSLTAVTNAKD